MQLVLLAKEYLDKFITVGILRVQAHEKEKFISISTMEGSIECVQLLSKTVKVSYTIYSHENSFYLVRCCGV